ncbi:hypothetical protein ACFL1P_00795 [Patescibacteria group bacterium]
MKFAKTITSRIQQTQLVLKTNKILTYTHRITIFSILISFALIVWKWRHLPSQIPLWYSQPWGTEQLADPYWLIYLPIGSIFWYGLSYSIVIYQKAQNIIFQQILLLSSMFISIMNLITIANIIFLIT